MGIRKAPGREKRQKFYSGWWVLVFIAACSFVYFNAVSKKEQVISLLDAQLSSLNQQKGILVEQNEDLLLQINSQSDPAWIELTLMKGLGLVPEGQHKVYFHGEDLR